MHEEEERLLGQQEVLEALRKCDGLDEYFPHLLRMGCKSIPLLSHLTYELLAKHGIPDLPSHIIMQIAASHNAATPSGYFSAAVTSSQPKPRETSPRPVQFGGRTAQGSPLAPIRFPHDASPNITSDSDCLVLQPIATHRQPPADMASLLMESPLIQDERATEDERAHQVRTMSPTLPFDSMALPQCLSPRPQLPGFDMISKEPLRSNIILREDVSESSMPTIVGGFGYLTPCTFCFIYFRFLHP